MREMNIDLISLYLPLKNSSNKLAIFVNDKNRFYFRKVIDYRMYIVTFFCFLFFFLSIINFFNAQSYSNIYI